MHQHHPDLAGVDLPVIGGHTAHEVVELRDHLHSGEAASGDHEGEELAPQLLVMALDGRFLERADHMVAQVERVVQVLEGKSVLGQAAQAAEIGDGPQREHQVVVLDHVGVGQEARGGGDGAVLQVDRLYLSHVDLGGRQEPPQRAHQIEQADGPGDHFRQHGLEDEVIVLGDQHDLKLPARAELLLQLLRGEDRAESAAEDHDALGAFRRRRTLLAEDAAHPGGVV